MSFKLFDKWDVTEVTVEDMGLQNYVCLDEIVVPHTMGRHVKRQFAKSKVSIVERLMNKIKQNPVQVLVKAVENTAPREETTRIKYGGIGYQIAVDIAPQRRVDLSLGFITKGAMQSAFKNKKSAAQCLADEILLASDEDSRSFAVQKKEEKERVARSAH